MSTEATSRSEKRFTLLLVLIVGLVLVAPWIQDLLDGRLLGLLFGAAIPLAGIYAVSDSRRHLRVAAAFVVPAVIAQAARQTVTTPVVEWSGLIFPFAFYAYATWVVGSSVFHSRQVTRDTLAGAAAVYLLIGILWWMVYTAVFWIGPESFAGVGLVGQGDLLYYSFVTLTTLGYGDITPVSAQTRSLAIVEAITGVLYMAIAIARLVGLYMAGLARDS